MMKLKIAISINLVFWSKQVRLWTMLRVVTLRCINQGIGLFCTSKTLPIAPITDIKRIYTRIIYTCCRSREGNIHVNSRHDDTKLLLYAMAIITII